MYTCFCFFLKDENDMIYNKNFSIWSASQLGCFYYSDHCAGFRSKFTDLPVQLG